MLDPALPLSELSGLAGDLAAALDAELRRGPQRAYLLIALVMLVENLFPPIPSEMVMPLCGFLIHQGRLAFVPVILAALAGTLAGAWFWYGVGRLVDERRLERLLARHGGWMGLRPQDLAASRRWFARHGSAVVFWGRLIPGVRPFVSLPAGIELMPQPAFLGWSAAGSLIWLTALTLAGQALGAGWRHAARWSDTLAHGLQALLVVALVGCGLWFWRRNGRRRRP
jgi:membrane protein DedA with SNARE-associated domain